MIRLIVASDGEVGVDLAGGRFGRGAHIHATADCLAKAPRGLSKTLHQPIQASAQQLAAVIQAAVDRRVAGLLASAVRAREVEIGARAAGDAFENKKARLLVVARDAAAAASVGTVMTAIAEGGAVAWGTKKTLGSLVSGPETAVIGIVSEKLSAAVRAAVMIGNGMAPSGSAEKRSPEAAVATED
jgi:ribosomal protein L7Ae-like RNA K-turn-binding protein